MTHLDVVWGAIYKLFHWMYHKGTKRKKNCMWWNLKRYECLGEHNGHRIEKQWDVHKPRHQFSLVQSLSHVRLFATPWITACQASLSITSSWSLPKIMSIEPVMPSSHLILCCPLLLLPPISPSIKVFSKESTLRMRWPKYWSFSFSISPSNEHPGLISFRMDWLDLLAVQEILNTTVQKHQLFGAQLSSQSNSYPYMTTRKTIALARLTFVGKGISLLLNMLSRLVITFLPRSKRLLISWLQEAF